MTSPKNSNRLRLIKLIHIARCELGMDKPVYRTTICDAHVFAHTDWSDR
jgi:hypothetical protein